MKKTIFSLVAVLGLIGFVAQAEEAPAELLKKLEEQKTTPISNQEIPAGLRALMTETKYVKPTVETIANISIRNAEISEIEKNHLKLVFDVENSMELQAGMIYGLELIKEQGEGEAFFGDVKIFRDDKLTVEKNGKVHREIEYRSPKYLTGDFVLWLKIKDESGLILATQPFNVNLSGTEPFIQQSNPCYLTIEGENEKKYNLRQGVDLKKEEKLFLNCQAKNLTEEAVSVIPSFELYRRDIFGPQVGKVIEGEELSFASQENKLTKIAIPLPENPQAYDLKVTLKKDGKAFSNPVLAHFVLAGKSASISNLAIDKNQYRKGEVAKLSFLWAGSADTFRDSRTGGSGLVDPIFEFEMKAQDGKSFCVSTQTKKAAEVGKEAELSLEKDCEYPIVIVRILDEGSVLYEKTIFTEPEKDWKGNEVVAKEDRIESVEKRLLLWVVLSLIPVVLVLLFWFFKKIKSKQINSLLLAVVSSLLYFSFLGNTALGATDTLYGTPWLQTWGDSNLTGTNWIDIRDCGVDLTGVPPCPHITACYYPAPTIKAVKYLGTIYGCYRDIVSFNYDLSSTSVNQGATITASGYTQGDNICNNGVTAGIAVNVKSGAPLEWVRSPVYLTDNHLSSGTGYYDFSTTGWNCQTYSATFTYAFAHGWTGNLIGDYDQIGSGNINYSVNNCCAPTCSTGPGCRSTALTNGFVTGTSGTCCGGESCYTCNDGYYWNGSMCTASSCGGSIVSNAAAYDAEESSAPVPASTNWAYSASDDATKCQYSCNSGYNWNGSACVLPTTYSCTGTIPANATMFSGDNLGLTANTPYTYWATDTGTKCQYSCNSGYNWNGSACVPVVVCSGWSLSLGALPDSGPASLSSNLTATINAVFGGENYAYSNHSCGSGGPAPINVNGGNFTCNYSSSGTYYPSVTARAQSTGCTLSASTTVSVSAAPASPDATLTVSPASVPYGGSSTLTWTTSNTASCLSDWDGWVSNTGGSFPTGALTASQTFNLTCWSDGGISTGPKSATVTVGAPPCSPGCSPGTASCVDKCGLQPNMPFCTTNCGVGDTSCSTNPICTGSTDCGPCNSGNWQEVSE
jgi:hypothetical protein